jgi:hypothetical protein
MSKERHIDEEQEREAIREFYAPPVGVLCQLIGVQLLAVLGLTTAY